MEGEGTPPASESALASQALESMAKSEMGTRNMDPDTQFIGLVRDGRFMLLAPRSALGGWVRLTSMPMQAAQPPDSAELDLSEYEGTAIMVSGRDAGGWIYSARVVSMAGPILTAVVQEVFGDEPGPDRA